MTKKDSKAAFELISDLVPYFAAATPDKVALHFEGRNTSWAELERESNQVGNALLAAGLKPGDRIGHVGKSSDNWFRLFFGANKAGIIFVPLNWRLSAPEMAHIAADAEFRLLFVDGQEFVPAAQLMQEKNPSITACISFDGVRQGWVDFTAWYAAQPITTPPRTARRSDVSFLMYTSGTTGLPKGTMISHNNFLSMREEREGVTEDDVFFPDDVSLISLPLGHIGGTCYSVKTLYGGARCHIMRELRADQLLDIIETYGISNLGIVPTALQILLDHPRVSEVDFSRLRLMSYGTSPIPLALLQRSIEMFKCNFSQSYGMTESTSTVVSLSPPDHIPVGNAKMSATGKALPNVQLRVVNEELKDVPAGTMGEVLIRSTGIMLGYWNKPAASAEVLLEGGWYRSGDAGFLDEDGYLYIRDRVKDMIISGGENIYSTEVENAVASHPEVVEVAVVGVPDPKWGERVKAYVVRREGSKLTEADIVEWARKSIAAFKVPRIVEFIDAIPKNATGKMWKKKLREMSVADQAAR